MKQESDDFEKVHVDITINLEGGGSTDGIAGFTANGSVIASEYPTNIDGRGLVSTIPVVAFYIGFNRLVVDGIRRSGITG